MRFACRQRRFKQVTCKRAVRSVNYVLFSIVVVHAHPSILTNKIHTQVKAKVKLIFPIFPLAYENPDLWAYNFVEINSIS